MKNSLKDFLIKHKNTFLLVFFLLLGFILRCFLTRFGNKGDVEVFAEWGKRYWELGPKKFYFDENWYYSFPTYPPVSSLTFGFLYWLYEHRYILAEIHNTIKIIPASFIIYFSKIVPLDPFTYRYGYYMLLKMPSILADLGISLILYEVVLNITKSVKKANGAFLFYLFNPITIFLSAVWGQNDSFVSFFGLLAFYLIYIKKAHLSIPAMFLCLFLKPTWTIILPLYFAYLLLSKVSIKQFMIGVVITIGLFLCATYPFSGNNIFPFTYEIVVKNMLPSAKGIAKASISAFNFHAIFFDLDKTLANIKFTFLRLDYVSWLLFGFINFYTIKKLIRDKTPDKTVFWAAGVINLGAFIILTNMLDRYFFAALPFMIISMFLAKKYFFAGALTNILLFGNIIWAFYRRTNGYIDHFFTDNNYLLVRLTGVILIFCWFMLLGQKNKYFSRHKPLL